MEVKVSVLFFSISAKLEHIHESSEVKGFVRIDHYSSQTRNWTKWEFDADSFQEAMTEVKKLETHMYNIPNIVNRMLTQSSLPSAYLSRQMLETRLR